MTTTRRTWVSLACLAVYVLAAVFAPAVATVLTGGMFGWSISRWAAEPARLERARRQAVMEFTRELVRTTAGSSSVLINHERGCPRDPCTCTPEIHYSVTTEAQVAKVIKPEPN